MEVDDFQGAIVHDGIEFFVHRFTPLHGLRARECVRGAAYTVAMLYCSLISSLALP
jgi:hypothetical protein